MESSSNSFLDGMFHKSPRSRRRFQLVQQSSASVPLENEDPFEEVEDEETGARPSPKQERQQITDPSKVVPLEEASPHGRKKKTSYVNPLEDIALDEVDDESERALNRLRDKRITINQILEDALKQMELAMEVLGNEGGKSMDDVFLESMNHWKSFQLKTMDMVDPVLRDEATQQFKVKLYTSWMQEIMVRITQYNPESGKAIEHMQTAHKILFAGSSIASFEEEQDLAENKIQMENFQRELEATTQEPKHNRFISVAPQSEQAPPSLPTTGWRPKLRRAKRIVNSYVPITNWLPKYTLVNLRGDIVAGITIGIMVIPQGMAYSLLAGLPPEYGLYSAFIPPLIYALFGTSNYMAISAEAISSLLIGEAVRDAIKDLNPVEAAERHVELANMMGFLMGALLFIFGLFQFGFLLNFLSRPVLSGFTSAAALVIALNQLKHFFGIPMGNSPLLPRLMEDFFKNVDKTNGIALSLAIGSLIILVIFRMFKYIPRTRIPVPSTLIVVAVGTLIVGTAKLDVPIVGTIPRGLPAPKLPSINQSDFVSLIQSTILISLVGFMESISVAKILASKHKRPLRENQEFIALGITNMVGSCFRCYPTAGALGRTAVNEDAGAKTQMSGVFSVVIVTGTLLFLTPAFYYLPNAILAAIIWNAVIPIIDLREAAFLWASNKRELVLLLLAFFLTLIFGVEVGVLTSVAADLVLIIYMASRPNTEVLGRLPGTIIYRNIEKFPEAITVPGVVIFRIDASLFFGNIGFLHQKLNKIRKLLRESKEINKKPSLVFVCDSVAHVDTTAIVGLGEIVQEYARDDILFCIAGLQGGALLAVQTAGLTNAVGKENFYFRVHDAVNGAISGQIMRNPEDELTDNKWMKDRVSQAFTLSPYVKYYLRWKFPRVFKNKAWRADEQLEEDDSIRNPENIAVEIKTDANLDIGTINDVPETTTDLRKSNTDLRKSKDQVSSPKKADIKKSADSKQEVASDTSPGLPRLQFRIDSGDDEEI
eukprot:TRINITY_DN3522_c0_g1_i1.p1 TRINITY_DN3522_c0_g1~~TRINITY_DN3522_c0_g1_i1.p1  ORF type:complete len:996 (-),score=239.21 TRINITY_DN3522_c0_g1_i1:49-3036(-)